VVAILPAFQVRSTAHKGQAMFAMRTIAAGEVIIREKPLIVMPNKIYDLKDMDKLETWMDKIVNKLPSGDREEFYKLSDCRNPLDPSALGIFFTNDMNYDGDAALFPIIARANHSCVPNADFITRTTLGVQDMVALRRIEFGEEILLCYLPASDEGAAPRKIRQDYMIEWYGFMCKCVACMLKGEALVANESLRQDVRRVQQAGVEGCSLLELETFFHSLWKIGVKPPYRREMARTLYQRAVLEGDGLFAARLAVEAFELEEVLEVEEEERSNGWRADLRSEIVTIGGKGYCFPRE